jgi:hypothetical protein
MRLFAILSLSSVLLSFVAANPIPSTNPDLDILSPRSAVTSGLESRAEVELPGLGELELEKEDGELEIEVELPGLKLEVKGTVPNCSDIQWLITLERFICVSNRSRPWLRRYIIQAGTSSCIFRWLCFVYISSSLLSFFLSFVISSVVLMT